METSTKDRSRLQSAKLKGFGVLKCTLTSDMETQGLKFDLLVILLAVVQYFLTVVHSLSFGLEMHIPCYIMLKVWDLHFNFNL